MIRERSLGDRAAAAVGPFANHVRQSEDADDARAP
jgi:hypothetical protein